MTFCCPLLTRVLSIGHRQSHENDVLKTIFGYYRRGKGDAALDLCAKCDQSWRAASLMGGLLWSDHLMGMVRRAVVAFELAG